MENLEQEIARIKERNKAVELDKAWETSWTRRGIIAVLTYLVIVAFMLSINAQNPWVNALVPTIGFVLSTLTLQFFRGLWVKGRNENNL